MRLRIRENDKYSSAGAERSRQTGVWTGGYMKKTLIFYKPGYVDLAIKLRDNYRANDHEEADIVSAEEHADIEYAEKCGMTKLFL